MNKIPAGLIDENTELFVHNNELKGINAGSVKPFAELPEKVIEHIERDMLKNDALKAVIELTGSTDRMSILIQYGTCCFGGINIEPDIKVDGTTNHDYHECEKRGTCKFEGKICHHIKVAHGFLTRREVDVVKLVATGIADKQIADKLGISTETLPGYMKNIKSKTGTQSKTELAVLAVNMGII